MKSYVLIMTLLSCVTPRSAYAGNSEYKALIPHIPAPSTHSFEAIAENTQNFVRENTVHIIDDEFYAHWHKPAIHVEKILAHINGKTDKRLKAECSLRAMVFQRVMREMGYEAKYVSAYMHDKNIPSHAFSEVKNPHTGEWQVYDTAYGVFWKSLETGKRLSAAELVSSPLDAITPCRSENICGWDKKSTENIKDPARLKEYIGALRALNLQTNKWEPLMINTGRFPINTPVESNNKTSLFCDVFPKACASGVETLSQTE